MTRIKAKKLTQPSKELNLLYLQSITVELRPKAKRSRWTLDKNSTGNLEIPQVNQSLSCVGSRIWLVSGTTCTALFYYATYHHIWQYFHLIFFYIMRHLKLTCVRRNKTKKCKKIFKKQQNKFLKYTNQCFYLHTVIIYKR